MSDPFHSRIHTALNDPILQSALDGNAVRRQKAWTTAFTTLPENREILRERAHAMRADVVAHLDEYLEQFISRAQANGIQVHHAANAAEAVEIVLRILQAHNATLVAKSKTMVSEEVQLNHALEQHGVRSIETDLGEYIVQLRHEPPAHITTPAVHLTRAQVAQTFVEKLGIAYTEDIPTLVEAARQALRQVFLDAQAGVTGVNFGVVETGELCLVTNEGNGRMCATLPPVHIAMMGIERMVPTLDDLALMLYLLPRSGTGQKLTVYTTLIQGPRRPEDQDGPDERHLVLLDNGRRALRASSLQEALYCIRCGACLNACPVFREIGGHAYRGVTGGSTPYPGPIGSVLSPGMFGLGEFGNLARATSLCGACKDACPVKIDLPKLLLRVRAGGADLSVPLLSTPAPNAPALQAQAARPAGVRSHVPPALRLGLQVYTWVARSPARFAAAQRAGALLARLAPWMRGWVRLPALTGWGLSRDFPLPQKPFRDRFAGLAPQAAQAASAPAGSLPLRAEWAQAEKTPGPASGPIAPLIGESMSPPVMPAGAGDLAGLFARELALVGGQAIDCKAEDLAGAVLDALHSRGITALQAWDERHFPPGLLETLQASGIRIERAPDAQLRAGLTGADAAIAESGTLALSGAPDRPLTAALLPEVHLAVLRRSQILPALPDALRATASAGHAGRVLITGPSRTADIEMALTIGVHGPREVLVFLI